MPETTGAAMDLMTPTPLFHLFIPTAEKIMDLRRHLMEDYLYTPDRLRSPGAVDKTLWDMLNQQNAIYYEIGNWQGLAGMSNIFPGWSAHVTLKFWGTELWGKQMVREMRKVLDFLERQFRLVRLESHTADPRIEKLTHLIGFETEGRKKKGFIFDGQYYDLIMLGRVKEG